MFSERSSTRAEREVTFYSGALDHRGKRIRRPRNCTEPIKILTFTWNVGNAKPNADELQHWLPADTSYDIVAVGTQENSFKDKNKTIKESSTISEKDVDEDDDEIAASDVKLMDMSHMKQQGGAKRTVWEEMVEQRLGSGYVAVHHIVLWEMRLTVYARTQLVKGPEACIFGVECASSATGVAGVLGNKGGLVIKLNVGYTSIAFVSCHLAAHAHKNEQRNENCKEILVETRRTIGTNQLDVCSEFDHVFWMGDLNYRVDLHLSRKGATLTDEQHLKEVKQLIAAEDWGALMAADQLAASQKAGLAFAGFVEGSYAFAPTFKVKRGVGTEHKDQRIPSYCDRVLWKSMLPGKVRVKQASFTSVPAVSTSDHKPVVASFEVTPSVGLQKIRQGLPVVRVSDVTIQGLIDADLGGGSDPYMVFFTNPPEVLGPHTQAPISKIKKATPTNNSAGVSLDVLGLRRPSTAPRTSKETDEPKRMLCTPTAWSAKELPLLRPAVEAEALQHVTLIIAIFDHDVVSADDLLGYVLVPLGKPAGAGETYEIAVDSAITLNNTTYHVGSFKGTLTVSTGGAVEEALQKAREEGVGTDGTSSINVKGSGGCCTLM